MNRQALSAPRIARELQDRSSASVNTRLALLRASLQVSSTGELWQPHEDAIVLENCRSGWRYTQIAPLLPGRTPEAVRGRFRALRLNADGIVRHGKPWSLQEKKSLVNMKFAQGLTIGVISKELGRSFRSTSSAWDLARKRLDADVIKSLRRHSFCSSLKTDPCCSNAPKSNAHFSLQTSYVRYNCKAYNGCRLRQTALTHGKCM